MEGLSLTAPLSEVLDVISHKVLGPPELRDKLLTEDRQDVFTEDGKLKEVVVKRMVETSRVQLLAWPSDDGCPDWSKEALQVKLAGPASWLCPAMQARISMASRPLWAKAIEPFGEGIRPAAVALKAAQTCNKQLPF